MNLEDKENIEINFWRDDLHENSSAFTVENFTNKTPQVNIFYKKILNHQSYLKNAKEILELGGGQGWASCFLKRFIVPDAKITLTDISSYALDSARFWENIYGVKLDHSVACKSYELPFEDDQFDFIFCYAAAHHFVKHRETLLEVKRVLKEGGSCIYFYEPTCSKLFYKFHFRYVNSQRPTIPEDVLIPSELKQMAKELDLKLEVIYDHKSQNPPGLGMKLYFSILNTLGFLQSWLPSSSDIIIRKL